MTVYDRRVERTRQMLRRELAKLMKEKPIGNITVKELCEAADINRSTFYLHYRDIHDMLQKVEEEIFENYQQTLQRYVVDERGWLDNMLSQDPVREMNILLETFRFIAKYRDVAHLFIHRSSMSSFLFQLYDMGKKSFLEQVHNHLNPPSQDILAYYYDFVAGGCLGLINNWIQNGMNESPELMSQMAQEFILQGQHLLQHELLKNEKE